MDKGAKFYRTDFQVHTPRDANWKGFKPVTDKDRTEFARYFVKHCRDLELNAVAITDHHDLVFFKYIKNEANKEVDEKGELIKTEEKLIVFPGVEVTLSNPPVQVLIILDASFPEDQFARFLNTLGIEQSPSEDKTTANVNPIPESFVKGLSGLHDVLDSIEDFKGKYIILPHVGDGGHKTLLRKGFYEYYKNMPCVGGYIENTVDSLGKGNKDIVNGINHQYGKKSIAVLQTSDNRKDSLEDLGKYSTWLKWSVPTAEAIRQACLAKESRITQDRPELPITYITKIDVTASKFLSSFSILFNKQYNALIGGRGTGKSTVLEYIRWALCDQTGIDIKQDMQSDILSRRQSLIKHTLVPFEGEVRITFKVNEVDHIVKRNSKNNEVMLKIGDGDFEEVTEEEIQRILPIQAYSQKQLSIVGIRTEELKRFIQQPIANELSSIDQQISDNIKETRNSYNSCIRKKQILNEIAEIKLEAKSLNNQAEAIRKSLKGMTEEDKNVINKKQKYDKEQNIIDNIDSEFESIKINIKEFVEYLKRYPGIVYNDIEIENNELIHNIEKLHIERVESIKSIAEELYENIKEEKQELYNKKRSKWKDVKENFDKNYEEVKAKALSNKSQLKEIAKIEERQTELNRVINEKKKIIEGLGDPEHDFEQLRNKWYIFHKEKIELLNKQAQYFSELSKGLIKAEVTKSLDMMSIKEKVSESFKGARINENKIMDLCNLVQEDESPLEFWCQILGELNYFAESTYLDESEPDIPDSKILDLCGYNDKNKINLMKAFTPEDWISLATMEIEFSPTFLYRTNNELDDVVPFAEASAGQQATALLTVLLNQEGTPLIIDQPEDDIDNRAIHEVINNIWQAKKMRQLIFTSHNANLVVNGDAELVIGFDYKESGNQTRGVIKAEGAIDLKDIRDEITSVMEGGEKAFKLRMDKYGF